jgi:hypothetical protein
VHASDRPEAEATSTSATRARVKNHVLSGARHGRRCHTSTSADSRETCATSSEPKVDVTAQKRQARPDSARRQVVSSDSDASRATELVHSQRRGQVHASGPARQTDKGDRGARERELTITKCSRARDMHVAAATRRPPTVERRTPHRRRPRSSQRAAGAPRRHGRKRQATTHRTDRQRCAPRDCIGQLLRDAAKRMQCKQPARQRRRRRRDRGASETPPQVHSVARHGHCSHTSTSADGRKTHATSPKTKVIATGGGCAPATRPEAQATHRADRQRCASRDCVDQLRKDVAKCLRAAGLAKVASTMRPRRECRCNPRALGCATS